jgi:hypothetical protein
MLILANSNPQIVRDELGRLHRFSEEQSVWDKFPNAVIDHSWR